jgi:chitinase
LRWFEYRGKKTYVKFQIKTFVSTLLATMMISTAHAASSASTTWPGQEVGVLTYQLSADKLIKTGPIRLGQMDFNISEAELGQIRASAPDQVTADNWVEIAILKRKVWRAPYSFVIPNERPHWAMAHAAQLFKNVTGIDDPFHSANLYATKTLQESAVGADYDAKTFTYPIHLNTKIKIQITRITASGAPCTMVEPNTTVSSS